MIHRGNPGISSQGCLAPLTECLLSISSRRGSLTPYASQRQQQHLRALMRVDRTEPLVARMRTAAITAPFINVRIGKTTFLDALQKIFGATGLLKGRGPDFCFRAMSFRMGYLRRFSLIRSPRLQISVA